MPVRELTKDQIERILLNDIDKLKAIVDALMLERLEKDKTLGEVAWWEEKTKGREEE